MAKPRLFDIPGGTEFLSTSVNVALATGIIKFATGSPPDAWFFQVDGILLPAQGPFASAAERDAAAKVWRDRIDEAP